MIMGVSLGIEMDELCSRKGIKKEFSNARTPQQNGVAERRNITLIETTRTMLADAKLPVTFWAEAVNTACYVQNKLLLQEYLLLTFQFREAQMATSNEAAKKDDVIPNNNSPQKEQQQVNGDTKVPESSQNSNPTTSLKVFTNDSFELTSSLTVETEVPTGRISFLEPLSLGNVTSFENRLEDYFGDTSNEVSFNEVEANVSNMETAIQNVWVLVDYPNGVRPIGTKWVLKNKKDERDIVIRNKARLVAQRHTQVKGIDYEEVFASVVGIEG
nr:Gag-Pol polyprotein [Tanacetum cinerariifolium]